MKKVSTIFIVLLISVSAIAGQPNQVVLDYIETYKSLAVREMLDYKIPASITLAQGIMESGAGQSELAKESNNHFGIKCHDDWDGDKVYYDDDAKNECFRKYEHVEDSYDDHSKFLSSKQRYAFLFELDMDDYKGWAKGLKEAGYATNPKYADLLIGLIEEYNLNQYDKMTLADVKKEKHPNDAGIKSDKNKNEGDKKQDKQFNWNGYASNVFYFNRIPAITVREGDTPEKLAKESGLKADYLYKCNDLEKGEVPEPGTKFYLQPKRKKGETKFHTVKEGETIWSISRDEGVRLDKLYEYNQMQPGQEPAVGEQVNLRNKSKEAPKMKTAKTQNTNPVIKKEEPANKTKEPAREIQNEEEIKESSDDGYFLFDNEELIDSAKNQQTLLKPAPVEEKIKAAQEPAIIVPVPGSAQQPVYHEVLPKETLYSLSKQYQVSVDQIREWNSLPDNTIQIGQKLIVGYH